MLNSEVKLVVVEDDPDDYYLFCDALAEAAPRAEVTWIRTFTEAWHTLHSCDFDLCLLDHHLPDGTGLALLDGLRAAGSALPVICLTGEQTIEEQAAEIGANNFLDKDSLEPSTLERSLRFALREGERSRRTNSKEREAVRSRRLESLGRLAGGVAHDFNNLLTIMLGHTSLLLKQSKDPEFNHDLAKIQQAGSEAASLTEKLLAFSRGNGERQTTTPLLDTLRSAKEFLDGMLGEDIELQVDLPRDECWVRFSSKRLRDVMVSLAANAREAMPLGGRVHFSASPRELPFEEAKLLGVPPGPYVELALRDTGLGMNRTTLEHAVEPFYSTKGHEGRANGLGLSYVYGVVTSAGGGLEIDSSVGSGTLVRIVLPAAEASNEVEERSSTTEGGTRARTEISVLLVDDDDAVRAVSAEILESMGYRVTSADSAENAVLKFLAEDFDVLVTDILMSGLTGFELADRLRRSNLDLSVVFVSGQSQGLQPSDGDVFLRKPFVGEELDRAILEACRVSPAELRHSPSTEAAAAPTLSAPRGNGGS